jgi:hypothetical protein
MYVCIDSVLYVVHVNFWSQNFSGGLLFLQIMASLSQILSLLRARLIVVALHQERQPWPSNFKASVKSYMSLNDKGHGFQKNQCCPRSPT